VRCIRLELWHSTQRTQTAYLHQRYRFLKAVTQTQPTSGIRAAISQVSKYKLYLILYSQSVVFSLKGKFIPSNRIGRDDSVKATVSRQSASAATSDTWPTTKHVCIPIRKSIRVSLCLVGNTTVYRTTRKDSVSQPFSRKSLGEQPELSFCFPFALPDLWVFLVSAYSGHWRDEKVTMVTATCRL
jgi:hypothetical protein